MGPILLAILLSAPSDSLPAAPETKNIASARDSADSPRTRPAGTGSTAVPSAPAPDSAVRAAQADSTAARPEVAKDSVAPPLSAPGPIGPVIIPGPVRPGPVVRPGPLAAPSTIVSFGPTGAIISVDTAAAANGPSTAAAVGLSILLPGTGHSWIGLGDRAPAYHALDLLGWAALFVSWQTGRTALSSAAEIANRYAGASLGSSPDPTLLSAMRSYRSRRPEGGRHGSYDEALVLSGKSTTSQFPDDASHDWDWGSTENPDNNAHLRAFENQYRRWRTTQVAMYYSMGSLAVLRLVAAMDVIRLQRASAARAGVALDVGPTAGGMDARVSWTF